MKSGDLVMLKSGGPLMTVQDKYTPGWKCTWWDKKSEEMKSEMFAEASLVIQQQAQ